MTSKGTERPTVVVVGGGYGGIAVAKALDATHDVGARRAEGRLHAQHRRPASAGRSIVASEDLPPVHRALWTNGRVVRDRACVEPHRVVTASGEEIGRVRRSGHRVEISISGEDRSHRHSPRSRSGPASARLLRGPIGSSSSEPARSVSSSPGRSVTCGRTSRSSCSTSPTRFSADRSTPSSRPSSDVSCSRPGSTWFSAVRCAHRLRSSPGSWRPSP